MPVPVSGLDWHVAIVDETGAAKGTVGNPIVTTVTGGGSATSATDEAAWTAGSSLFNPVGAVFNDSAAALSSGQQGTFRSTPNRAIHVNLRSQNATEILPVPAALADGTANPTLSQIQAFPSLWNGATWDRWPGTAAAGGKVQLVAPPSTANSSTTPLGGNGVFTGTSEDVSGYATVNINVLANQASAAGGLSVQFSSDGTNWDFVTTYTVAASTALSLSVSPQAKFFRLVYTNGAAAQATFRLQTVFHQAQAAGLGVVPLLAGVTPSGNAAGMLAAGSIVYDATADSLAIQRTLHSFGDGIQGGTTVGVGPFLWNGTTWDRARIANTGAGTTGTGLLGAGVLGFDGTNYQRLSTDTSGRQRILAVDGASALIFGTAAALADAEANPTLGAIQNMPSLWNGTTWDRWRSVTSSSGTTGTGVPGVGNMLWDLVGTTNFVKQAGDGSGRAIVVGAGAAGAAITGNPNLIAGTDGTNAVIPRVDSNAMRVSPGTAQTGLDSNTNNVFQFYQSNGATGQAAVNQYLFNGLTWDRQRNNIDVTLLASAARTTTQGPTQLITYNAGVIIFVLDMTTVGTGSVTLTINEVDPASGKSILLLSGAAVVTNTTNVYIIDPVLTAAANSIAKNRVTRTLSWTVTANNANSATYSLGAMVLLP